MAINLRNRQLNKEMRYKRDSAFKSLKTYKSWGLRVEQRECFVKVTYD